jgi:hypothetical protein
MPLTGAQGVLRESIQCDERPDLFVGSASSGSPVRIRCGAAHDGRAPGLRCALNDFFPLPAARTTVRLRSALFVLQ